MINIDPKENILDPQGKAVAHALVNLGFNNIGEVRIGKHIVLDLHVENKEEAFIIANEICEKLLVNPLIEEYSIVEES